MEGNILDHEEELHNISAHMSAHSGSVWLYTVHKVSPQNTPLLRRGIQLYRIKVSVPQTFQYGEGDTDL